MAKYVYPAIFTKEDSGLYSIMFPDFKACFTQGEDVKNGMYMAADILTLTLCDMEDSKEEIPVSSNPHEISFDKKSFISLVCADTLEYRKTYNKKAVKKTLTIPQWLDERAIKENINFSQTLQKALMEQLHIN